MSTFKLVNFILVVLVPLVAGYPDGPPVSTNPDLCKDMIPTGHGVDAQTTGHPYEVVVAGGCYKPGVPLPVFVRRNESDNSEPYYEGLFVMARNYQSKQINKEDNVGTFDVMSDSQLKTLACFSKSDSAVGQSTEAHYDCKRFNWMPPASMTDDIIFHATIVRNKEKFWMDVLSATISYDENCSPDASTVDCVTSVDADDDDDDDDDESTKDKINGAEERLLSLFTWITCALVALLSV